MSNSEEIIRLGNEAEAVLNSDAMKRAFDHVAADITGKWATTSPADVQLREKLYLKLQVVQEVREHLRAVASNGQFEKSRLQKLAEATERFTARLASYRFRA